MEKDKDDIDWQRAAAFLKSPIGLLFIFAVLFVLVYIVSQHIMFPKKSMVTFYGVDRKTFSKWMKHFCSHIIEYETTYKKRRKLTAWECFWIWQELGDPIKYPSINKKEIIVRGEGTYYSLRDCITRFPDRYGLPLNAYLSMNKFPPNISRKIVEVYG